MVKKFPEIDFGLYRDDGLGAHKRIPKTKLERIKKDIIKMFKDLGLSITIQTNLTEVNFLDVTLNLHKDEFWPYRKPNSEIRYINVNSNHPPSVIKQIPASVNKRLNQISHNANVFHNAKKDYEHALRSSGHNVDLKYEPEATIAPRKKRNRNRQVIWYNPPYNKNLKTNLGREFLNILDSNFPKHHPLHKILNRKTVKISYSCTNNMEKIMNAHNKKLLSSPTTTNIKTCNCRNKAECPVPGKCCTPCVVYEAQVNTNNKTAHYIGSTGGEFKIRFNGHKQSFRQEYKKSSTALSQFVWDNNLNPNPQIKWKFLKVSKPYAPGQASCDVCASEKLFILKSSKDSKFLNKRNELVKVCPHKAKYRLDM